MKKIKYLWWLIVLSFIGVFIYQNLDYFMTTNALKIDLKIASWNWTMPELQNIAYFGICFLLGLFLAGVRGFIIKRGFKKDIKQKDAVIISFKQKLASLKSELDVFQHDPYIKKEQKREAIVEPIVPEPLKTDNKEGDKS
jgi:hypothetical protein